MIVTVTLNPAIDKTIEVNRLTIATLNKVENWIQDPGGKGINVSKVIESLGGNSIATGFLGGSAGRYIMHSLDALDIKHDFVMIDGETRTNLKIFDRVTKENTEINERGPSVSEAATSELLLKVKSLIKPPCIVVISGSTPEGLSADFFSTLVLACKEMGAKVFLDTYGCAFESGIKAMPDYIMLRHRSIEKILDCEVRTDEALVKAGQTFMKMGAAHVLFSLGPEGNYYCDAEKSLRLRPIKIDVHSTVGAGDALVGGFVYALDQEYDIEESLRLAMAASAGAVMTVGTKPMNVEWITSQIDRVVVEKI